MLEEFQTSIYLNTGTFITINVGRPKPQVSFYILIELDLFQESLPEDGNEVDDDLDLTDFGDKKKKKKRGSKKKDLDDLLGDDDKDEQQGRNTGT